MRKHATELCIIVLFGIIFVLTSACQSSVPPPVQVSKADKSIEDIRVRTVSPIRSVVDVEKFNLPNCGGTGKLTQSLGTQASVLKGVTIGARAKTMAGGEVAIPETVKLKLEIEVELAYQQTYQTANSRLDTIEMPAAPGTDVTYVILWEEQRFDSIVSYAMEGEVFETPYNYVLRVPKIDDSYQNICHTNQLVLTQSVKPVEETNLSPTDTPFPTHLQPDEKIFTVSDAEQTPLGPPPNCDYWLPSQFTLFYDLTEVGSSKKWDLTQLPSGMIIGDAYKVSIDSVSLGQQVIFVTSTNVGQSLSLTDGAFLIVSSENADGVLRLRQRNLECRGLDVTLVRYP